MNIQTEAFNPHTAVERGLAEIEKQTEGAGASSTSANGNPASSITSRVARIALEQTAAGDNTTAMQSRPPPKYPVFQLPQSSGPDDAAASSTTVSNSVQPPSSTQDPADQNQDPAAQNTVLANSILDRLGIQSDNPSLRQKVISLEKASFSVLDEVLQQHNPLHPETEKTLQSIRRFIGLILGQPFLEDGEYIALKRRNSENAKKAEYKAILLQTLSELNEAEIAQSTVTPKPGIRTAAAMLSTALTFLYFRPIAGFPFPSSWIVAAMLPSALVTASTVGLGDKKTDEAIQYVQNWANTVIAHLSKNRKHYGRLAFCAALICMVFRLYTGVFNKHNSAKYQDVAVIAEPAKSDHLGTVRETEITVLPGELLHYGLKVCTQEMPNPKSHTTGTQAAIHGTILKDTAELVSTFINTVAWAANNAPEASAKLVRAVWQAWTSTWQNVQLASNDPVAQALKNEFK